MVKMLFIFWQLRKPTVVSMLAVQLQFLCTNSMFTFRKVHEYPGEDLLAQAKRHHERIVDDVIQRDSHLGAEHQELNGAGLLRTQNRVFRLRRLPVGFAEVRFEALLMKRMRAHFLRLCCGDERLIHRRWKVGRVLTANSRKVTHAALTHRFSQRGLLRSGQESRWSEGCGMSWKASSWVLSSDPGASVAGSGSGCVKPMSSHSRSVGWLDAGLESYSTARDSPVLGSDGTWEGRECKKTTEGWESEMELGAESRGWIREHWPRLQPPPSARRIPRNLCTCSPWAQVARLRPGGPRTLPSRCAHRPHGERGLFPRLEGPAFWFPFGPGCIPELHPHPRVGDKAPFSGRSGPLGRPHALLTRVRSPPRPPLLLMPQQLLAPQPRPPFSFRFATTTWPCPPDKIRARPLTTTDTSHWLL